MSEYTCEVCGVTIVGWRALAIIETASSQYEGDHYMHTIPVCWTCRHEFDLAMKSEIFNGEFAKFIKRIIDQYHRFKGVINRQVLPEEEASA